MRIADQDESISVYLGTVPCLVHDVCPHKYFLQIDLKRSSHARHPYTRSIRVRCPVVLDPGLSGLRIPVSENRRSRPQERNPLPIGRCHLDRASARHLFVGRAHSELHGDLSNPRLPRPYHQGAFPAFHRSCLPLSVPDQIRARDLPIPSASHRRSHARLLCRILHKFFRHLPCVVRHHRVRVAEHLLQETLQRSRSRRDGRAVGERGTQIGQIESALLLFRTGVYSDSADLVSIRGLPSYRRPDRRRSDRAIEGQKRARSWASYGGVRLQRRVPLCAEYPRVRPPLHDLARIVLRRVARKARLRYCGRDHLVQKFDHLDPSFRNLSDVFGTLSLRPQQPR